MSNGLNPSDLKARLDEINKKIDYFKKIRKSIRKTISKAEKSFFGKEYSCPDCGSENERKIEGGVHHKTAKCKNCGFNATIFD